MNRSAKVAALALLVVLLGHPLAAVCACAQQQAEPASAASGCHESNKPGTSVKDTARDCCQAAPAEPAPAKAPAAYLGASPAALPNLELTAEVAAPELPVLSSESPPRSLDSSLQAFYCVFLI